MIQRFLRGSLVVHAQRLTLFLGKFFEQYNPISTWTRKFGKGTLSKLSRSAGTVTGLFGGWGLLELSPPVSNVVPTLSTLLVTTTGLYGLKRRIATSLQSHARKKSYAPTLRALRNDQMTVVQCGLAHWSS